MSSSSKLVNRTKPLYLITDGALLRRKAELVPRILEALEAAEGAIAYVQLREQKGEHPASDKEVSNLVEQLLPYCNRFAAELVINNNTSLALGLTRQGLKSKAVHLGAPIPNIENARSVLGNDSTIGYSAHSVEEAESAFAVGADYVFLSPIFTPLSKASSLSPLGVEELKRLCSKDLGRVFALGGIEPSNISTCRDCGVDGVAVISSVLLKDDVAGATRRLLEAWRAIE